MEPIRRHEIGALEHTGVCLPRQATALAVWRLVRRPMELRRISAITSTAHGLSPAVRSELKFRAIRSLVIALDCAVQAGRAGWSLTTNRFLEALAERWSAIYRQTRKTWGTGSLAAFKPETVIAIREEIVGQGIAYQKIWTAIRSGVPGLYKTSAPIKDRGRKVMLVDDEDRPLPLLANFDRLIGNDPRYRRDVGRTRLLLASEAPLPRKVSRHVAGERPFDIMSIGQTSENILRRLEAARVFLQVAEIRKDIKVVKAKLAESQWPRYRQLWDDGLPRLYARAGLGTIPKIPRSASAEKSYWARVARANVIHARKSLRAGSWRAFLATDDSAFERERNRHRALRGRLAAMEAIDRQLQARGVADDAAVEIRSGFYKHCTRRFQAMNVWPSDASSHEEEVQALPADVGEAMQAYAKLRFRSYAETKPPTEVVIPQRIRWFKARAFKSEPQPNETAPEGLQNLWGLDVSGSQAQILAVVMGLREMEKQLQQMPFKKLVAISIRRLQQEGRIQVPPDLLKNEIWLENVAKGAGMPGLYGARPNSIASGMRRDPDQYGPGLDTAGVKALFSGDPTLRQLRGFLSICEAVGRCAYTSSNTGGVVVVDPLDGALSCEQIEEIEREPDYVPFTWSSQMDYWGSGASFTWNPPKRVKVVVGSGGFKLCVRAPVVHGEDALVDERKLTQRIGPGLIHMLDSLFASIVILLLNWQGVRDVISIHDAFLVPAGAHRELRIAVQSAGRFWLPLLGPFYDVFERYLPATSPEGKIAREWGDRWKQRVADCKAGLDKWPDFRTKLEAAEYRF